MTMPPLRGWHSLLSASGPTISGFEGHFYVPPRKLSESSQTIVEKAYGLAGAKAAQDERPTLSNESRILYGQLEEIILRYTGRNDVESEVGHGHEHSHI